MHHSLGDNLPVCELHTSPPNNSIKYYYLPFSLVAAALGWGSRLGFEPQLHCGRPAECRLLSIKPWPLGNLSSPVTRDRIGFFHIPQGLLFPRQHRGPVVGRNQSQRLIPPRHANGSSSGNRG